MQLELFSDSELRVCAFGTYCKLLNHSLTLFVSNKSYTDDFRFYLDFLADKVKVLCSYSK